MDRPHAPMSSDTDDDIIELTDIVEKGDVPDVSAAGAVENPLEAQMADLLAGAGKAPVPDEDEFDLDALLKATGLGEDGGKEPEAEHSPAPADSVGDEDMDMPDMGDVDALLRDLVAPEQPESASAAAPAPVSAASLNVADRPDAEDVADAAAPTVSGEDDMDDLDTLLTSLDAPQEQSEVHAVPMGETATPDAPASASTFSAVLDETVIAVSVPDSAPAAPDAEPEVDVDDLDSLLDSIMNPDPAPQTDTAQTEPAASVPTAEAEDDAGLADLDALLSSAETELSPPLSASVPSAGPAEPSAPEAASPAAFAEAPAPGLPGGEAEDNLDALLTATRTEMESAPEAEAVPAPEEVAVVAESEEQLDEDPLSGLDALLMAAGQEERAVQEDAMPDTGLESTPPLVEEDTLENFPLEQDLGDPLLVGEAQPDMDLGAAVLSSLDALAADIAAMQEKLDATAAAGPDLTVLNDVQDRLNDMQDHVDDAQDRLDDLQAEMHELAESHARGLAAAESRISALEAELAERSAHAAAQAEVREQVESHAHGLAAAESRISALEDELAERSAHDAVQAEVREQVESHAHGLAAAESRISALEGELAERSAQDAAQAEVREQAESHAHGLAAAEARISALEAEWTERGAREAAPLVMPPAGSAFREELAALVKDIVVRELQNGEHVPPYAESMSTDIVRLEDRVTAVETGGEKAAAEAAARVIREEIAALISEMGQDADS